MESKINLSGNIGYTGVPGSFSHEVLMKLNIESKGNIKNYKTHEDLIEAVSKKELDYGVLPVENSTTGDVRNSIELINNNNIFVVGEVNHRIKQTLLGVKGSRIEDIKNVLSHEQAFFQCSNFLREYPEWNLTFQSNTAISAKNIKELNDKDNACIASIFTKDIYDLEILQEEINNNKENFTRFVIVGNKLEFTSKSNKISFITAIEHKSGTLFKLLEIFAKRDLNMLSIKSKPIPNRKWEYYFYIDFEGNLNDESVKNAFNEIESQGWSVKILGNYEMGV